jgi:hypothetical protein
MVKWGCRELADPKMAEWHLIELAGALGLVLCGPLFVAS